MRVTDIWQEFYCKMKTQPQMKKLGSLKYILIELIAFTSSYNIADGIRNHDEQESREVAGVVVPS
jgi:hypothetical protein